MNPYISLLMQGITMGFIAGIAPGPLMVLVITQTLQHNWREGVKIALAPLFTDVPILFTSFVLLSYFTNFAPLMAAISFAGAFFLTKTAIENWNARRPEEILKNNEIKQPGSIVKGVVANFLSPYPYVFWFTIGTPIILNSGQEQQTVTGMPTSLSHQFFSSALFMFGLFSLMISVKISIALLTKYSSSWLKGHTYSFLLKTSSCVLMLFAITFVFDALNRLSVFS